ncbi:MAG: cytochrome C [Gemmatimonadota bacterium]
MRETIRRLGAAIAAAAVLGACTIIRKEGRPAGTGPFVQASSAVAAGEYLTTIGGCNDCHTPNWHESGGNVSLADRLTGVPVGWRGPWGTTYASNLRLSVQGTTARDWIRTMRETRGKPPMPWTSLHAMGDRDLEAVYAFIVSLGPKGEAMPKALPPDSEPATPYILLMPASPKGPATRAR